MSCNCPFKHTLGCCLGSHFDDVVVLWLVSRSQSTKDQSSGVSHFSVVRVMGQPRSGAKIFADPLPRRSINHHF